jgi:hypothetical protein
MSLDLIIALLVFAASLIGSIAGAYATVTSANNKAKEEATRAYAALREESASRETKRDVQLAVMSAKMDTLWDIYAEDAIRQAWASGTIAAKSPLAPTEVWEEGLSEDLAMRIKEDANEYADILNSPYDIAMELWAKYKNEILSSGIPSVRVLWGTILVVSMNAARLKE